MGEVRTRFAPSPTGRLHPGSARTALFNYLFARHYGGKLVVRIEDTDLARSSEEFEQDLLDSLNWLGLYFDDGPYRQSERGELYMRVATRLSERGLAYEAEDDEGRRALYFKLPDRAGTLRDELRGEVRFSKVRDFVVIKSDGTPSYNFAAVVDDLAMGITHVIRGEEHLSNTARQVLLYRALDADEPKFIHLGLILGPDGRKLSKRHGAQSVAEYRRDGYLPEVLVNYLALLGWTHPEGREEFAGLDELAREWDPSRLGASPAAFDLDRLLSLNARHIRRLPAAELSRRLKPFLDDPLPLGRELEAVEALREEMRLLSEAPRLLRELTEPVDPTVFAGELPPSSDEVFTHTIAALEGRTLDNLDQARGFVGELRVWAKAGGIEVRDLLHPLRLALTGKNRGPEMARLLLVLGAVEARERIERAREARLRS
ncbi:MAG TPA: glutamate--tRNA ligase family protein [Rubrobacteraceae bacterium]|nr:glutamate--tRNA ligase family protein [Rubrobacteraceae bacterium]